MTVSGQSLADAQKPLFGRATLASIGCGALAMGLGEFAPSGHLVIMFIVIATGAIALTTLGRHTPGLRHLGGDALLTLLVPSFLVYIGWFSAADVDVVAQAFNKTRALEIFVTIVVAGAIISTERQMLRRSAVVILPIAVISTVVVLAAGLAAGALIGQDLKHVFLFILCPMLSGGLAAGLVPLSVGYSSAFGITPAEVMASILPPLLLSNIAMILVAGWLSHRTGQPVVMSAAIPKQQPNPTSDPVMLLPGAMVLMGIFLASCFIAQHTAINLPLAVIVLAVGFSGVLPARLQQGASAVYHVAIRYLTLPMIFAVGLVYTPWGPLIAGLAPERLAVIVAGLAALCTSAWYLGRAGGHTPAETVFLASSRVAMGGSGALAILQAARRLDLMPPAQIIVRVGGIATVSLALLLA